MTDQDLFTANDTEALAEGVHMRAEAVERISTSQTGTVPVTHDPQTTKGPAAETGIVSQVRADQEGKDDGESQDASLTYEEKKPAPAPQKSPVFDPDHKPSVLIIEDTTELAEIIQATLERKDIVTAHETHGNKALARFFSMKPDVVLLDISLPDMTGWKILETIKEKEEQGEIVMPAIVVITAYGDPANRLVGKLQGVHSYLVKPFTSDEVEKVVVQALGNAAS